MVNESSDQGGQPPRGIGSFAWLIEAYGQAIALLENQAAQIETLEREKDHLANQYREALQQYHQLKEQYDHQ